MKSSRFAEYCLDTIYWTHNPGKNVYGLTIGDCPDSTNNIDKTVDEMKHECNTNITCLGFTYGADEKCLYRKITGQYNDDSNDIYIINRGKYLQNLYTYINHIRIHC